MSAHKSRVVLALIGVGFLGYWLVWGNANPKSPTVWIWIVLFVLFDKLEAIESRLEDVEEKLEEIESEMRESA